MTTHDQSDFCPGCLERKEKRQFELKYGLDQIAYLLDDSEVVVVRKGGGWCWFHTSDSDYIYEDFISQKAALLDAFWRFKDVVEPLAIVLSPEQLSLKEALQDAFDWSV